MNDTFGEQIEDLRKAILGLPATGETGFEGLIGVTLTEITGVPFRLARSGSQHGVDANPAYQSDSICFEGKRYDGSIPRAEILSKIAELSIRDDGQTDLWVLGASTAVSSQLANDVRKLGDENGIGTLILDWSGADIPPLAVALAMSETKVAAFLNTHLSDRGLATKARKSRAFAQHAARIRSELQEPTMGFGVARPANIEWLNDVFSSKQTAQRFLGQPLSPHDPSSGIPLTRATLVSKLKPLLTGKPDGRIATVLGDEGSGKSWLVAQSWVSLQEKPVMIVLTPDDFIQLSLGDVEGLLISKLAQQTGDQLSDKVRERWRRKLKTWRTQLAPDTPRHVVFIDGLNQRPKIDWARFMDALASELIKIGGRLVVTARTHYFNNEVRRRVISALAQVDVPEWTEPERDEILATHGIRRCDLHERVAAALRNPRLLGIALALLKESQIRDLDELSVSRLLFEHMRASERDAPSPRPAHQFARKLQDHAREILSRSAAQRRDDLKIFDGDMEAVSDGRFFIPVAGDPTRYTLADHGLTLALGFSIVDRLQSAVRNHHDPAVVLAEVIEPIAALDQTAAVVLAALTIACLDDNRPVQIGAALVASFAQMQNPSADDFQAFAGLVRMRSDAFMNAAHDLCLAGGHQPNFDWIEAALHIAKVDDRTWSLMSDHLRRWLAYSSLSPERGIRSPFSREPSEKREKERSDRQKDIDERLSALSPAERDLLNSLTRKDDGDLSALVRLAVTLMSSKPVAPFSAALVHHSFAESLNPDRAASSKELTHLLRFNRADWRDTREAVLRECRVLESPDVSPTGKWAIVKMLRATGNADDAARVEDLLAELTANWPRFEGWRLVEKYCASDPCDPDSARPDNIANTAKAHAALDVSKLRQWMSSSSEDHFFSMASPGLGRFEPKVAIDKRKEFIADVIGRKGLPLRQGLLQVHRDNSLLTRGDALRLLNPVGIGTGNENHDGLGEDDLWLVRNIVSCLPSRT